MSTAEILDQLPKLSQKERRAILDRLIELDVDSEIIEERRQMADESFQLLDALEDEDAQRKSG